MPNCPIIIQLQVLSIYTVLCLMELEWSHASIFPYAFMMDRENVNCRSEFRDLIKYHSAERVLNKTFLFFLCVLPFMQFP